jgi:hypothetical protein
MSYKHGFGQAVAEGTVFSLTDPDVAAQQPPTPVPSSKPSGGSPAPYYGPPATVGKTSGTPITSASLPTYAAGAPNWMPWAIGGTITVVGIGLVLAALRR